MSLLDGRHCPVHKEAHMIRALALAVLVLTSAVISPPAAFAEPINFKMLSNYSRATFKTDAPLETIVGTTAGAAVTGNLTVDPLKPAGGKGSIKVDLTTLNSGVAKRDQDMQEPRFLDTANDANKFAVFEVRSIDIVGPLEAGKEVPAKVKGVLTIKQKPVDVVADARVTYVKLTPQQVEAQKRFGFTADNLKVRAKFGTTFTNHGMAIPEMLFLKVSNEIELETDLTFTRQ
jgi:polyisoprenoid-binding protein YceI